MGGAMGAKPPWRGVGGVPQSFKIGGELLPFAIPPRVGPKALANLKPTGEGTWEVQGGEAPMAGGLGGVPPKISEEGASCYPLQPRQEWDLKRRQTLSQRGWAKRGSRGAKPPGKGSGGCAPKNSKEGASCQLLQTRPRVGPKTPANPKPPRVGKGGSRGHSPLAGGVGGVPPQIQKRGQVARISNPATSGTQGVGKP